MERKPTILLPEMKESLQNYAIDLMHYHNKDTMHMPASQLKVIIDDSDRLEQLYGPYKVTPVSSVSAKAFTDQQKEELKKLADNEAWTMVQVPIRLLLVILEIHNTLSMKESH